MRWTPGWLSLVIAVGFLALVAAGVEFLVRTPAERATFTGAATEGSMLPLAPTTGPAPPGVTMMADVTMTARPTPKPEPSPARPTAPTSAPTPVRSIPPVTDEPTAEPLPAPTLDFELSSFNVLGASHERAGKASGVVRAGYAAELLRRHGSDVVGFQELQGPQLAVLQRRTGMDFYPGFSLGRLGTDNSIGWRRDSWEAVERHTLAIPYFNGGRRDMPYVRLRHRSTGIEAWFANFHNPAETAQYHHQQRFREAATRMEIDLANRLVATGLPVFITGDMNERAPYFCRLTARAPMVAARGGTNGGRCLAGRPRAVDWIFGSQGVEFTGYLEDRSRLVDITTDHPVLVARVHLVGVSPGTAANSD